MCVVFYSWLPLDSIVFQVPHLVAHINTILLCVADKSSLYG